MHFSTGYAHFTLHLSQIQSIIYLPLSMCTAQLPPIPPTLCASPIFAPLICLFCASPLNWIAISHICETPVAPIGCPLAFKPPEALIGSSAFSLVAPLLISSLLPPFLQNPKSSIA